MVVSRLLAKGWTMFCLFAGLYAAAVTATGSVAQLGQIAAIVLLFGAMGLLFIAGFAAAVGHGPFLARLAPSHLAPGFTEIIYLVFAVLSLAVQAFYAPAPPGSDPLQSLLAAVAFAVPGQEALNGGLVACGLDGGRLLASGFAWILAFILFGSSLSRLGLAAGIVRLERKAHGEPLTPAGTALLLGASAIVCAQLLYLGSLYPLLPCRLWQGIGGDLLIGQAPLMLAYLVIAALTSLFAMSEEA